MAQSESNFSRLTPKQWQQIINRQHENGLSQKAFCQSQKISLSTFTNRKRKLRQEQEANSIDYQSEQLPDWIEFQMDAPAVPADNGWHMKLELPGGVVFACAVNYVFFPESQVRVWLYNRPTDMKKFYDGLSALG